MSGIITKLVKRRISNEKYFEFCFFLGVTEVLKFVNVSLTSLLIFRNFCFNFYQFLLKYDKLLTLVCVLLRFKIEESWLDL